MEQMYVNDQRELEIYQAIKDELDRAQKLYPDWWQDMVYGASTAIEESGEAVKAVNDLALHGKGSIEEIRKEAIHSAAMWIRFLVETDKLWQ